MPNWPENVGILGIEIYFPAQYVDQTELEAFDGAAAGKYTIGLGQQRMGFCTDQEDINSMCLTVVHKLIDRHGIDYAQIGRLEVGTETILDKSKSIKTVLMQLFAERNLTDIEGIDTTNACYGGTAALLNALNWVESSAWDGRLALVVCGDIAVYAKGNARPTGGAGAIAMLVGPGAPLVIDRGLRSTHMQHAYDFYKPDLTSEFPTVDGKLSIQCYLSALDICYQLYAKKAMKLTGKSVDLNHFDAVLFHTPYCKLVQKSLARLSLNDYLSKANQDFADIPESMASIKLEDTYFDRDVEKAFLNHSKALFEQKTKPSLLLASQIGNMYTPSLYGGLISLLVSKDISELAGNKVGLFSYGSGLASTMFSITVSNDFTDGSALHKLVSKLSYVKPMLAQRAKIPPQGFSDILELRQKTCHAAPYTPNQDVSGMFPGTYYLSSIDEMHRRVYQRVPGAVNGST